MALSKTLNVEAEQAVALERGSRWRLIVILILAVALLLYIRSWEAISQPGLRNGELAADFTLTDLSGHPFHLAGQAVQGRALMLNFFSVNCPACQAELPTLITWSKQHPEVTLILVAKEADANAVQAFTAEHSLPFTVLLDPQHRVWAAYKVTGAPTSFFLDAQGTIRTQRTGGPVTLAQLDSYLGSTLTAITP